MQYHLKKSLGQHFLKDDAVISKILDALWQISPHQLLEVGPGGGALTRHIFANKNIDFKCVELDDEKVNYLKKKINGLHIIHQDFLEMDPPFDAPFSIIGNFPYNISSQILFKIIEWFPRVEFVIGMFQKEVARRIITGPGSKEYGVLSVLIQLYYETEYLFDVAPDSFTPPPKVDSGVIKLRVREHLLAVSSNEKFRQIVKASFAMRRKTLRNNLRGMLAPGKLKDSFFDRRAETLSVEEFAQLSFEIE